MLDSGFSPLGRGRDSMVMFLTQEQASTVRINEAGIEPLAIQLSRNSQHLHSIEKARYSAYLNCRKFFRCGMI